LWRIFLAEANKIARNRLIHVNRLKRFYEWLVSKSFWPSFIIFAKSAVVPVIVVIALLLIPLVRNSLTVQFQGHPLLGALILVALCFVAGFLATNKGTATSATFRDAGLILGITLTLLGFGLICTGASTVLASEDVRGAALRSALLWATACFMAGFLGGFLFGVPKVVDNAPQPGTGTPNPSSAPFTQRPNTNLEQISDWLTKIIVGLGLVELKGVPSHLRNAATWMAESFSTTTAPNQAAISFAGSLIIYFSILGFLAGYLLTLLFLAGAFGRAGQQAYGGAGSFGDDALSKKIRDFYRPNGGPPNPENARKLTQWIKNELPQGTSIGIGELIGRKDLDQARQKVVAELNIV
jgi:hypothetical protein